jgi:TolB-like protein
MVEPAHDAAPFGTPAEDRLDSWKEIAAYLSRDVTTVQRWEKREGMPVHRHVHDKRGSVYALPQELDIWMQTRRLPEVDPEIQPEAEIPGIDHSHQAAMAPGKTRLWLALAAALCICLLAVAWFAFRHRPIATAEPRIRSLAVLPLKNLSGDPAQEYFADGMTEEVIGRLSMIRGLRVISRTSVMQFKDTQLSAPEIAKKLGVDALVEGSVIREGGRIRVHVQLIRGATDEHFWSEEYDRDVSDVLALQSSVAQAIAEKVQVTLSSEERSRLVAARQVSPEVYESYLKGRSLDDAKKSIAYFEEAIKKDPTFAPAYVGLAYAYFILGTPAGGAPPQSVRPRAISAAHRALELDPTLPEPHVVLALSYQDQWEWRNAEHEFKRALELNPNNAWTHVNYAGWMLCQGRLEEAQAWARRGRELDPFTVDGHDLGWILFQSRRYDEAIRELRSNLAVHPDGPGDCKGCSGRSDSCAGKSCYSQRPQPGDYRSARPRVRAHRTSD